MEFKFFGLDEAVGNQTIYRHPGNNIAKRDGRRLVEIMLTNDEWKLLGSLCEVLKEFADATEQLEGSTQ